jgi:phospholipase/carboxylesterase
VQEFDGIERELGPEPDLSIIWLHGLGADASDFLPIIGELDLPADVRFVFPNAPPRPVTINGGMVMRAWYDILGFGADAPEDADALAESVDVVRQLVQREVGRGIAVRRIVLAGFSQGGAVALHAGLGGDDAVGGILGLSTYLPVVRRLKPDGAMRTDVPVMLAHGLNDPIISVEVADRSARFLIEAGVEVDWSTYPMAHEVSLAELRKISDWLRRFESR